MKRILTTLLAATMLVGVFAVPAVASESDDIVTTVVESKRFDILEALVVSEPAVLDALVNADDVTVFAPTDWAMRKLLFELTRDWRAFWKSEAWVANQIIGSGNDLVRILSYHVYAGGAVPASVAVTLDGAEIPMLSGILYSTDDVVEVNDWRNRVVFLTDENDRRARVVKADIEASNGIIHAINRVILPAG